MEPNQAGVTRQLRQVGDGDRAHFLAIAARVMRQVLVDYTRRRKAAQRGGDRDRVTLSGAEVAAMERAHA
jgi:hypothetical protein